MRGAGVLERIRQRLLHDPVGREVDPRRELHRLPLHCELHRQSGLAHLLDERRERPEARLRRERGDLFLGAHDPEQPPHLRERLAPCLLDRHQGLSLSLLLGLEQPADGARLDRHHADRVREHVVQLAGDPVPLVLDGSPCLLLGVPHPLLSLAGLLRVPRRGGRDHEDADEREAEPDQLRPRNVRRADEDRPSSHEERPQRGDRQAPVEQRPRRPGGEQERQEHRVGVVGGARIEQREDDGAGSDDERRHERRAATEDKRSGGDEGDRREPRAVVIEIRPDVDLGDDNADQGNRFEHVLLRPRQG